MSISLHTGVSTVGGDRRIISGGKGHEAEAKVCKQYGKHCKRAACSYLSKVNQPRKAKDMCKTVQIIFMGIGAGLFGCGEDACR